MAVTCLTFCPTNEQLVAMLPRLHAGEVSPFVHRADVYSAAPADLVGNLVPAQGTDKGDGYGSVWYLLCPMKYMSNVVKPHGKRRRSIGGGEECWHAEAGPKKVDVVVGDGIPIVGYARTFSYGYKMPPPAKRQFKRLGWCMVEYVMDDASYDHVLCKVYRSPRAKASSSGSKRKATGGGDHPEAPPARLNSHHVQETTHVDAPVMPVQVQHGAGMPGIGPVHGGDTSLFSAGFSLGQDLAGINDEELLGQLLADYDPLAWPASPDYHFSDDHLIFGPN